MENYIDLIVNTILRTMKDKNITASKLERELDLGNRTISHWKNGTQPTLEKLIKVAKYLDISIDEILEISNPMPPAQKSLYIKIAREDLRWINKCLDVLIGEDNKDEMIADAEGIKKYIERALNEYDKRDQSVYL